MLGKTRSTPERKIPGEGCSNTSDEIEWCILAVAVLVYSPELRGPMLDWSSRDLPEFHVWSGKESDGRGSMITRVPAWGVERVILVPDTKADTISFERILFLRRGRGPPGIDVEGTCETAAAVRFQNVRESRQTKYTQPCDLGVLSTNN